MSNVIVIIVLVVLLALSLAAIFYLLMKNKTLIKSKVTAFGLRDIGELATQAGYFTSVQKIEDGIDLLGIKLPLTLKKCIFSYDSIIKAGINFKEVKTTVDEENKIITVLVPPAEILSIEIDEESFVIYDEVHGIFNPLKLEQMNEAIKELKEKIEKIALKNSLLENAHSTAEALIKGFLIGVYGSGKYRIVFKEKQ